LFCRSLSDSEGGDKIKGHPTRRQVIVSTFAIAQTPTKQPALRLSRTKNLHFAKATFPGFSAAETIKTTKALIETEEFLPLAWAGMPKTSFRKNSDSPQRRLIQSSQRHSLSSR
jgi:hypothetical protein